MGRLCRWAGARVKRTKRRPRRDACYEWPSLQIIEVPEPSTKASLLFLAETVVHTREISDHDRDWIAQILKRVAADKRGLEAARLFRRRDGRSEDLALDYLVHKELAGPRRAKQALVDVAIAWGAAPETVRSAARQWRHATRHRLEVIARKCADAMVPKSRKEILDAVSKDLRAWHGVKV